MIELSNDILLAFIATLNVITAVLAYKTHVLTKQVEVATNSMKDRLIVATGEAKFAEGKAIGKAEGP